jgi:hypothetical protein
MNVVGSNKIIFVNTIAGHVRPPQIISGTDAETLIPTDFPDVDDKPAGFPDDLKPLRDSLIQTGNNYKSTYHWRYHGTGILKIIIACLTAIISGGYLGGLTDNPYLFGLAFINIILAAITAMDSYYNFGKLAPLYFTVAYEYLFEANNMVNTWRREHNGSNDAIVKQNITKLAQNKQSNLEIYMHDVQLGKIPIPGIPQLKVQGNP